MRRRVVIWLCSMVPPEKRGRMLAYCTGVVDLALRCASFATGPAGSCSGKEEQVELPFYAEHSVRRKHCTYTAHCHFTPCKGDLKSPTGEVDMEHLIICFQRRGGRGDLKPRHCRKWSRAMTDDML